MREARPHPFADRWNHNMHYFPLLASRIPESADRLLDVGSGDGTFCRFAAAGARQVVGVDVDASVVPPSGTWSEARALAHDALPGSTYRRLAMWRSLIQWRKPRQEGAPQPGWVP